MIQPITMNYAASAKDNGSGAQTMRVCVILSLSLSSRILSQVEVGIKSANKVYPGCVAWDIYSTHTQYMRMVNDTCWATDSLRVPLSLAYMLNV